MAGWLNEPEVEEVVLRSDGAAWVRRRDGEERREPGWGATPPARALERLASTRRATVGRADVDVEVSRRGPALAVRLRPRRKVASDLAGLQRDGRMLPEVRVAIEESIRGHRGILVASPHGRPGGALFEALVEAWSARTWTHRLPPGAGIDEVRAARALGADVVVLEFPQVPAWREVWMAPGPVLVRAHAPSSGRALRMIAAFMAGHDPSLSLDVARELVVTHVDLVVEEEADGRARSAWRVLPDVVPAVEFLAGTRARLPNESGAPGRPSTGSPSAPLAIPSITERSAPTAVAPPKDGEHRAAWSQPSAAWANEDTPDLFQTRDEARSRSDVAVPSDPPSPGPPKSADPNAGTVDLAPPGGQGPDEAP